MRRLLLSLGVLLAAPPGASAAPVAPQPVNGAPKPRLVAGPHASVATDGRRWSVISEDGVLRVVETGRRIDLEGCSLADVAAAVALLDCETSTGIADLATGEVRDVNPTGIPDLVSMGDHWIHGTDDEDKDPPDLFFNWRTGEQRDCWGCFTWNPVSYGRLRFPQRDLDSPDLAKVERPAWVPRGIRIFYVRGGTALANSAPGREDMMLWTRGGRRTRLSSCRATCGVLHVGAGMVSWVEMSEDRRAGGAFEPSRARTFDLRTRTPMSWRMPAGSRYLDVEHTGRHVWITSVRDRGNDPVSARVYRVGRG